MTYRASLDKTAIMVTTLVTIFFVAIIVGQYFFTKHPGRAVPTFTTAVIILVYLLAFAFRPVRYVVTGDELIVHRPLLNARIKRAEIKNIELIDRRKIRGSIRTFGVGGLFGYFGKFANFSLGSMTWYATRKDRPVLVETKDDEKLIFTPDDPDSFVNALKS
ncbi:MAG TPA: PH domain-containing protein [Puia sp.]|nr:PH domain-containing protein [Puia sp.]